MGSGSREAAEGARQSNLVGIRGSSGVAKQESTKGAVEGGRAQGQWKCGSGTESTQPPSQALQQVHGIDSEAIIVVYAKHVL